MLTNIERAYKADRSASSGCQPRSKPFARSPLCLCRKRLCSRCTPDNGKAISFDSVGELRWQAISQRQSKTGGRVVIPCTAALKTMLDGMPRHQAVVLTTPTGRAWTAFNFLHRWKEAMTAAGLSGLHFHDLRGTAVTMLAEAGCTHLEIAAITGHSIRYVGEIWIAT